MLIFHFRLKLNIGDFNEGKKKIIFRLKSILKQVKSTTSRQAYEVFKRK